jgi:CDP-diacylglycerol--glycerol-3-phosphate 3-phosphatidyltransferase
MTVATWITLGRIVAVPIFAGLAVLYGQSVANGAPVESLRGWAVVAFVSAAVSDGVDGWVARRFNQRSRLGAILDPIADKGLLLTAVVTLALVDWGGDNWRLPMWFAGLVIARDAVILGGIAVLHFSGHQVEIAPRWVGKVCTVSQMFALGWVMLKVVPFPPFWPCLVAAFFTLWSLVAYTQDGVRQLRVGPRSASPVGPTFLPRDGGGS